MGIELPDSTFPSRLEANLSSLDIAVAEAGYPVRRIRQ